GLHRGVGDATALPRGAAGLDLGGLRERDEPRRAARADPVAARARGLPGRGRAGRRRRCPPGRARGGPEEAVRGPGDARGPRPPRGRIDGAVPAGLAAGARRRSRCRRRVLRVASRRRRRARVRHAAAGLRLRGDHRALAPGALAPPRPARRTVADAWGAYHLVMPPRRRTSFQLARIFGIRVGVSASWFFVLFILIYWLGHEYFPPIIEGSQTTAYLIAV